MTTKTDASVSWQWVATSLIGVIVALAVFIGGYILDEQAEEIAALRANMQQQIDQKANRETVEAQMGAIRDELRQYRRSTYRREQ